MGLVMKKAILSVIILLVLGIGVMFISMSKGDIEDVIACSLGEGTHYIPESLCKYYLYNYRANDSDINYLQMRSGLNFIVNILNVKERNKLLKYFISKGLDINKQSNVDGFTPIHAAILLNDEKLVSFLLANGASLSVVDKTYMLTPIQFVKLLIEKKPSIDRNAVLALLTRK